MGADGVIHESAARYLSQGRIPIPIPRIGMGKSPNRPGWAELRPSPSDLQQLFPHDVPLNLGLLLGEPSGGLVDVDLDCPEAIRAAPHLLPGTGWISGRAGAPHSHWWYTADQPPRRASTSYRGFDSKRTVLVELRSTGGQTVAPPSIHYSGEEVRWYRHDEPAAVTMAELLPAVASVAAVALLARHWCGEGSRQEAFLALAGGLHRLHWPRERAEQFVRALADATHDEEAPKRVHVVEQTERKLAEGRPVTGWRQLIALLGEQGPQVVQMVREWLAPSAIFGHAAGPAKRRRNYRRVAPYQPFPVETLPQPLREFVVQQSLALGCDPAYVALPVMAATASAIGNTRVIRLKRGWDEPSVIWSVIIAESGSLKSPAYEKAVAPFFRIQRRLLKEFKEAEAEAKEDSPLKPVYRRVIISDITIPKIAEVLEDNPRGILVARDELAAWLGSFRQYRGRSEGSDLPHWLEMHRAGPIILDRKTGDRRHYFVERAAASVTGGIQPRVMVRAFTDEFLDAGGGARLLMAMPDTPAKSWSELEVETDVLDGYCSVLDRLLALEFDDEETPHVLTLSPEAKATWVAFYNAWAREQASAEGELAAALAKLEAYAARFALLHHVVTHVGLDSDDRRPIGKISIEAGVALCRWFADEARRVYATLTESPEERHTRRLVELVRSRYGGRITARQLTRANNRRYPDTDAAEAALGALVEDGLGHWGGPLTTSKGGRPTRPFVLQMHDNTPDDEDDDDDGPPEPPPEPPPDETPPTNGFSRAPEGFVSFAMRRAQDNGAAQGANQAGQERGGFVTQGGDTPNGPVMQATPSMSRRTAPAYRWVRDAAALAAVAAAVDDADRVALDLETTGLNPRLDRVRLLSLAVDTIDGGTFCYLIDCFEVDPAPLWAVLASKELVAHNAAFDLASLARLGFTPTGPVHDTMLLAQLLAAGTHDRCDLAACCKRWLGTDLDKTLQKADWSGDLSSEQLAYAARDVEVLSDLYRALSREITQQRLDTVVDIERRCLPALVWASSAGVAFDTARWRKLAEEAGGRAHDLLRQLDATAAKRDGFLGKEGAWNWNSPVQVQEALEAVGCVVESTREEALAKADHPLADLLRQYRAATKLVSTYGTDWLKHVSGDGRIYPTWRQLGAASSGRMSCSDPNLQQVPRGAHRSCFVAPPGRVLVKADYSQIELRIAAKVSGDQALLDAYRRGDDLHTLTARHVLGIAEVSREHRQLAKALNFGLLYGMGAKGFRVYARTQYGVELTEEQAHRYRNAFFGTYPGLARWHRQTAERRQTETRTLAGRRRPVDAKTPLPLVLNTPIQGTGADGLKLALALLWERRHEVPGAVPVLIVHDEIVVESDADQADAVATWLKRAMVEAMAPLLEPVPVEVAVKAARTWGGA